MKEKIVRQAVVSPPTSREEAAVYIRRIGEHKRKAMAQRTAMEEKLEKIRQKVIPKIDAEERAVEELVKALYKYASENREELTKGGKLKTVPFPTGSIGWKLSRASIVFKGKVEEIIKRCKEAQFEEFIRVKKEIDKNAMLKEKGKALTIEGVTIEQKERFIVEPGSLEKLGIKISKNTEEIEEKK